MLRRDTGEAAVTTLGSGLRVIKNRSKVEIQIIKIENLQKMRISDGSVLSNISIILKKISRQSEEKKLYIFFSLKDTETFEKAT